MMRRVQMMAGWLAAAVLLLGCEPRSGLDVRKEAGGYVLHFKNCMRATQVLPIKSVRISSSGSQVPQCELTWQDRTQTALDWTWTYAAPVPGYKLGECNPLVPGATYDVHIAAGPVGGEARFQLEPDGSVKTIDDGCK
jgi:hypothetical protein